MRTYGEGGYKAVPFLARAAVTAVAENLELDNVPEFVEAGLQLLDSHYQHYAQDIWKYGSEEDDRYKMNLLGV